MLKSSSVNGGGMLGHWAGVFPRESWAKRTQTRRAKRLCPVGPWWVHPEELSNRAMSITRGLIDRNAEAALVLLSYSPIGLP